MRRILLSCASLLLVCLAVFVKPAIVKTDDSSRLLVLLRWQSGDIRFINSVTGEPVRFRFQVGDRFRHFTIVTDEKTEDYYTSGLYPMNETLSANATGELRFCSIKGIQLSLGFYNFDVKDGCLEVKLLWTI